MDDKKTERTDTEILKELIDVLMQYNSDRDDEWDFADVNRDTWSDEDEKAHDDLVEDIQAGRNRIQALIREATGDNTIEF